MLAARNVYLAQNTKHLLRLKEKIVMHAQYTKYNIMIQKTKEPAAHGARNKGTIYAQAHGRNDSDYISPGSRDTVKSG